MWKVQFWLWIGVLFSLLSLGEETNHSSQEPANRSSSVPERHPKQSAYELAKLLSQKGIQTEQDQQLYFLYLYHAGNIREAVDFFSSLPEKAMTQEMSILFCQCLITLQEYAKAYELLQKLDNPLQPNLQIDLLRIQCLIRMEKWQHARTLIDPLLRIKKDSPQLYYYGALIAIAMGDQQKAISLCQKGLFYCESGDIIADRLLRLLYLSQIRGTGGGFTGPSTTTSSPTK